MDGRYLIGAFALVCAGGAWQYLRHSNSAFAWSLPFALILVFLALTGESPAKRTLHWLSDDPVQ